jgi:hypothetical protein
VQARLLAALLLLAALNASAFAQYGARDATAQDATQALQLYLERTVKLGTRPDYTKPPAADLFRHVFELGELRALPPPNDRSKRRHASGTDFIGRASCRENDDHRRRMIMSGAGAATNLVDIQRAGLGSHEPGGV